RPLIKAASDSHLRASEPLPGAPHIDAANISESEQIRHLNEELTIIVDKRSAGAHQVAVRNRECSIEVLQVGVVSDVDGGAGVDQVRDQKICVEVFCSRKTGQHWVGKHSGILQD